VSSPPDADWVDRLLVHIGQISDGRCTIDDQVIAAEPDENLKQVWAGLLVAHDDLSYAREQRRIAECARDDADRQREAIMDDLRRAIATRDEFLAIASHELRTPLATLLIDLSSLPIAADAQRDVLQDRMLRQLQRLNTLVERMLDVSAMTRGRFLIAPARIDLSATISDLIDGARPTFSHAGVELVATIEAAIEGDWDALRLEQVVTNLLGNALKYGEGQPVEIGLRSSGPSAILRVRDHGRGVPPEKREKIFEAFARGTEGPRHEGLGLGLWISREIVHASGGQIRFLDVDGKGACVEVELCR
jgi:signal transduction histidine kinase